MRVLKSEGGLLKLGSSWVPLFSATPIFDTTPFHYKLLVATACCYD